MRLAIGSLNELGSEIGDECQGPPDSSLDAIMPTFVVNKTLYELQLEYSNRYHACANTR